MHQYLIENESNIRLSVFVGSFALLAAWEQWKPRRRQDKNKLKRWANNLGLLAFSTVVVRLIVPTAAIGAAYLAHSNEWGLVNHYWLPDWSRVVISVVLLDLIIYFQHLTFHELPLLWRFHRVHHSDQECDVSTGVRFHPIEIFISALVKMAAVIALGAPVLAVILYETMLNFASMFTHANLRISPALDRVLRWFIVTPDMHRIHHSSKENETNSNFGAFIPYWDRLFGSYLHSPEGGQENMHLGLDQFNSDRSQRFLSLLLMPIKRNVRGYAINMRDLSNADELIRINAELNILVKNAEQAKREAQKADQAKSAFISKMSHELMTPLNAVIGYSDIARDEADMHGLSDICSHLSHVKQAGLQLHNLMQEILEYTHAEAEKSQLDWEQFDFDEYISEFIAPVKPLIDAKENGLEIECSEAIGMIVTDKEKLSQILLNLISNAAKFTESGMISIIVQRKSIEESNCIEIKVKDSGIGIEPEQQKMIFKGFMQHAGLGLPISQHYCEILGGKMSLSSEPGKGSEFTFWFPDRHSCSIPADLSTKRRAS